MMEPELEIIIDEDGTVTIEGHGYSTSACSLDIERLTRALGTVRTRKKKAEARNPARAATKQAQKTRR